ncbi:NAD(P)H-quinone oxidoreductase [Usitatibacter palustris]|uniref:Phthiocerol synthesis polyketide synthase type I PpsC n=1 Tax=Usitatibacter palustris TaxID=2732487 RepID=A0A6M4H7U7_9PROT|nr:NAD(P)H-quinone oxidoreductase [Usitatibacter palustris]QJR14773.1 Phthiocerol synthesis polyketide synthase type I PpsC [Usitatibacter palustris]
MTNSNTATHRVVEITTPGKPEVLQVRTRDIPQPAKGDVLIKVAAAGVNRPDVLQRIGRYPVPPGASDLPGLEVAGTVEKVGEGVTEWKVGDRVCALTPGGGYAEHCIAPASNCLPIPKGFDFVQAASLPETYFTVWSNVFDRGGLKAGESFLVQGGSSGIGVAAIQIVKAMGHRVFATAGSEEKCKACEALGAERAINYKTEDFVAVVKEATGGKGVNVVLDMVAGEYIARECSALADDGRIVLIATLGGSKATVDMMEVMRRRLSITGSTLRPRSVEFKAAIAKSLRERVWPLLEAGTIKPVIHARFPLADAAKAHAMMEGGEHIGKIVLEV